MKRPMKEANPVIAEVLRGELVESRHRGAYCVADAGGRVVEAHGNVDVAVFARSALKPLQALPLIETGAADRFELTDKEIALACASHAGEAVHVELVRAWLARIGLGVGDLECGPHAPLDPDAAAAMVRAGESPRPIHNNCSGKHAGFLATALHMGEPTEGYVRSDHPVQVRVAKAIAKLCGIEARAAPKGVDGCGVPVLGMGLRALAGGMARLAAGKGEAERRVIAAMAAYPVLIGGNFRFDTRVMIAAKGSCVVKVGAEGVHAAALPGAGLGIAVKVDDGAKRASETVMATLLARYGIDAARAFAEQPVLNAAGLEVGLVRAVTSKA